MGEQSDLRVTCQAFIASAFTALTEEHVLPAPVFGSYLAVGRDYFGGSVMPLAEFAMLEATLNERYPERFADPLTRRHAEFASTYIFKLSRSVDRPVRPCGQLHPCRGSGRGIAR